MQTLRKQPAFTLAELLVALAILGFVMAGTLTVLLLGGVLYEKNVAINLCERDARYITARLRQELVKSLDAPVLLNVSPFAQNGTVSTTTNDYGWGVQFTRLLEGVSPLAPIEPGNRTTARFVVFPSAGRATDSGSCELRYYPSSGNAFEVISAGLDYVNPTDAQDFPFRLPRSDTSLSSPVREEVAALVALNIKVLSATGSGNVLQRFSPFFRYSPGVYQNSNNFFQLRSVVGVRNLSYER